jgi:hypothetical protein
MAENIFSNYNSLHFIAEILFCFSIIELLIFAISFGCWLTGLASLRVSLEASILLLLTVAILYLRCLVIRDHHDVLMERNETYIEDRLGWLKEAADSFLSSGVERLRLCDDEKHIDDDYFEREIDADWDLSEDDDSKD